VRLVDTKEMMTRRSRPSKKQPQVIVAMWRPRESALNLRFNTSFIFRETPETAWSESRQSIRKNGAKGLGFDPHRPYQKS